MARTLTAAVLLCAGCGGDTIKHGGPLAVGTEVRTAYATDASFHPVGTSFSDGLNSPLIFETDEPVTILQIRSDTFGTGLTYLGARVVPLTRSTYFESVGTPDGWPPAQVRGLGPDITQTLTTATGLPSVPIRPATYFGKQEARALVLLGYRVRAKAYGGRRSAIIRYQVGDQIYEDTLHIGMVYCVPHHKCEPPPGVL